MQRFLSFLTVLGFLFFQVAWAEEKQPDQVLKEMMGEVLTTLSSDESYRTDTAKLNQLVEKNIFPHINFRRMTALAVGRDWRKATEEEKTRLTNAFTALLVRTYSNALANYGNEKVVYKPVKMSEGVTEVLAKIEIQQPGSKPVNFDTRLEKKEGTWKVYDVAVEGISLVTNYRDQFAQTLKKGGFPALIDLLENQSQSLINKK